MEPTEEGAGRSTIRFTATSAALLVLALLAALVLRNVFAAAHRVLGWGAASTVVAIMLKPPIDWLSRFVPKVVAVLVAGATIATVAGALLYGIFGDLEAETRTLQRRGPAAASRLEGREDRIGEIARDLRLVERAEDAFEGLEARFGIDPETIASAVGTAPSYFVCFILTIFLVLYGPRIVEGAVDQIGDVRRRQRVEHVLLAGVERGRGYLWWALLQGTFVGTCVFAFAETLDLPAPTVLALIAAVAGTVPYIGILIGIIPTVMMTAGLESAGLAAVVVGVGIAAQAVEATFVRHAVDRRTLHVGPAIPVIVGSIGLEAYGIGGALYGAAVAVLLLGIADVAATDADEPLPTPNQDWDHEPEAARADPAPSDGTT